MLQIEVLYYLSYRSYALRGRGARVGAEAWQERAKALRGVHHEHDARVAQEVLVLLNLIELDADHQNRLTFAINFHENH